MDKIPYHWTKQTEIEGYEGKTVMEKIHAQEEEISKIENLKPSAIYIGRESHDEFERTEEYYKHVCATTDAYIKGRPYTIKGIPFIVVPWMDGVLVAPAPNE